MAIRLMPDVTFLAQLVIFLTVVGVLKTLVIDPTLRILKWRERSTKGELKEVEDLNAKIETIENDIRDQIGRAKREQLAREDGQRVTAEQEARNLLETARAKAQNDVAVERERIEMIVGTQEQQLQQEVPALAKLVKEGILGSNGKA